MKTIVWILMVVTLMQGLTDDEAREEILAMCPGPFSNHGQCISCVADAAKQLKQLG